MCTITKPGDKWCVFIRCMILRIVLSDAIEEVRHSVCSLSFKIIVHCTIGCWILEDGSSTTELNLLVLNLNYT